MTERMSISDRVTAALVEMDPDLKPTAGNYGACAILVASALLGADEAAITEAMGYEPAFVVAVGECLRANGIWRGKSVAAGHRRRWDGEAGGIAFFLDCNVGHGDLRVTRRSRTEAFYAVTEQGSARVKRMVAHD